MLCNGFLILEQVWYVAPKPSFKPSCTEISDVIGCQGIKVNLREYTLLILCIYQMHHRLSSILCKPPGNLHHNIVVVGYHWFRWGCC